jgi:hypothetical protein
MAFFGGCQGDGGFCAEIKIKAERKAGELLVEQEKNKGGRPSENR